MSLTEPLRALAQALLSQGWFNHIDNIRVPKPESDFRTIIVEGRRGRNHFIAKIRASEQRAAQEREVQALHRFERLGLAVPGVVDTMELPELCLVAILERRMPGVSLDVLLQRDLCIAELEAIANVLLGALCRQFDAIVFPITAYHSAQSDTFNSILVSRMRSRAATLPPIYRRTAAGLLGVFAEGIFCTDPPNDLSLVTHDWCKRHLFLTGNEYRGIIDVEFAAPADRLIELSNFLHDLLISPTRGSRHIANTIWRDFGRSVHTVSNWETRVIALMVRQAINLAVSKHFNGCREDVVLEQLAMGERYAQFFQSVTSRRTTPAVELNDV